MEGRKAGRNSLSMDQGFNYQRNRSGEGSRRRRRSRRTDRTTEILANNTYSKAVASENDDVNIVMQDDTSSAPPIKCRPNSSDLPLDLNAPLDIEFGDGILDVLKDYPAPDQPSTFHNQQPYSDLQCSPSTQETVQRDIRDVPIEELTDVEYAHFLDEVKAILCL